LSIEYRSDVFSVHQPSNLRVEILCVISWNNFFTSYMSNVYRI